MRTNNIFSPKKLMLLFLIGAIGFTGCKKFLDINQNPNNPDSAEPSLLLPTVEAAIGQVLGNAFQVPGNLYAQYWTQNTTSSQYKILEQYSPANSYFDGSWLNIYRSSLENAQIIINNKGAGLEYTKGIAYILKAYTFQLATDAFGDIPLSQALQGNTFSSPKYESQQLVYDSVFNYIDKGIALLNTPNAISPANQDLIFKGDITQWKAFANTLKLKAYLRLYYKDQARATAGIKAIYQANPTFLAKDAAIQYLTIGGNEYPFYNEMLRLGSTQNVVASATAVTAFTANNDPRLFKFYKPVPGDAANVITAIPQGSYQSFPTKKVSSPTALVGGDASDANSAVTPVKLFSLSESYFLQAEVVARGLASGDVATLFKNGINASFTATGINADAATLYINNAKDAKITGVPPDTLIKRIITQKYYAMTGLQGFEAWTEYRRTGYPDFLIVSKASLLGGNLKPLRFIYPNTEVTTNLNYPGTVPITTPLWWATK